MPPNLDGPMKFSQVILIKMCVNFIFNLNQNKQTEVLLSSRLSVSLSKDWQKSYALALIHNRNQDSEM